MEGSPTQPLQATRRHWAAGRKGLELEGTEGPGQGHVRPQGKQVQTSWVGTAGLLAGCYPTSTGRPAEQAPGVSCLAVLQARLPLYSVGFSGDAVCLCPAPQQGLGFRGGGTHMHIPCPVDPAPWPVSHGPSSLVPVP